jgi:hypothetical protein
MVLVIILLLVALVVAVVFGLIVGGVSRNFRRKGLDEQKYRPPRAPMTR